MSFEVSVTIAPGDRPIVAAFNSTARLTALVGPSGSGKTSVLNAIAGLVRPVSGRICVSDRTLFDAASGVDVAPDKRGAGYVFQDARLFPHRRVGANLAYAEKLGAPGQEIISRHEAIALLDIAELLDRWPATLSGGETRRVAIARALLCAPRFVLLDEPTASLDAERAGRLLRLIERIKDEVAIPILLVSHSVSEVERLADETVSLGA